MHAHYFMTTVHIGERFKFNGHTLYIICELTMMLGAMQSPVEAAAELKRTFTKNSKRIDMLILIEKIEHGAESGGCLCDAHAATFHAGSLCLYAAN